MPSRTFGALILGNPDIPYLDTLFPLVYIVCSYSIYSKFLQQSSLPPSSSELSVALSFAFPIVPHPRAALVTLSQLVPGPGGHPHQVTRRAEACATASGRNPSRPLRPFPRVPHSRAALDIQHRSVSNFGGHPSKIRRRAATCVTACNASHLLLSCSNTPWDT